MMKKSYPLLIVLACIAAGVQAKLPPPSPEAKAAADAAKDKAAWTAKVADYKLCMVQDRVAAQYLKNKDGAKKPTVETPPCKDPGPYVPPVATEPAAGAPAASASAAPATTTQANAAAAASPAHAKK